MKYILICLIIGLLLEFGRCESGGKPQNPEKNDENVNNNENDINTSAKDPTENVAEKPSSKTVPSNTTPKPNNVTKNTTELQKGDENLYERVVKNKAMLMRTFYVLLGVTSIVVLYFVVRAWRSKRRHSKSRKYGLITSSGADLEMEPLDQDVDDDDEMTMFERQK